MKNATDTKTAILDVAQDLLQRQSISGVSFQELANRIGIKKGSMYYHFETKDDLATAILTRASKNLKLSFERGYHKTATQQLDYFFNIYRDFIRVGERLCPGGAFAGEWGKISEPVKKQVNKLIQVQIQGLKDIITAGLKSGEFECHDLSLDDLTLWLVSCLHGSLLTSRIMGSKKSFNSSIKIAQSFLYKVQ